VADVGVRHVFLTPGGDAMHLNDSLSRGKEFEFVCNLHEQATSIAAENYSKAANSFRSRPGDHRGWPGLAGQVASSAKTFSCSTAGGSDIISIRARSGYWGKVSMGSLSPASWRNPPTGLWSSMG
jgi:Thiamine pyrophosphate enzyme, N-terminal TPP binding domain